MLRINWYQRLFWSMLLLVFLLFLSVIVCTALGSASVAPAAAFKVLFQWVFGTEDVQTTAAVIVTRIRLPRIVLAFFVGAALSAAGAALQGLLRNPLAEPYTLGVASGAAVGTALTLVIFPGDTFWGILGMPLVAFLGALLTGIFVYRLALVEGHLAVETLILAGVIMNSFMSAVLSFLLTIAGENMHQIIYWMMGNLNLRGSEYLLYTSPYLVVGVIVLCLFGKELNILTFGEETAGQLGVSVERIKKLLLFVATLLTGVAVALAGTIGFIGLIVPHLVRLLLGPDHRVLIPVSAVGGGVFLIWADTLARTLLAPVELPVGVVTAFLGVPFFVYLLRTRKR